ncbi:Coenzyme F420 hydrogenase/dehydrogenase, beta subunit C-terminal domain [Desulfobacter latus]|uniref:Coenzyme F420 hydrogenase/dehydrogenase, beta subunit C-terminal domain n=1 Tax=Desulfobacter latus TaxID=2292 RepID=A0A850SV51_9BACT|nr:Coenzyme F420 hydrogenase/dehydrogenase, beta subunit C-terminal domain [Desulfobacter latus]NWH05029.1 Coenzyme F420 hydrogenase/dehydrogenase, beta subunit C-terminal domain [Desulfobacter latus]
MNSNVQHPLAEHQNDCTGCSSCAATCPKQCIHMIPDQEGFLNPQIQIDECIDCGLCLKVCPVAENNVDNLLEKENLSVFAAWHKDESIRKQSSSGGVFTALAESILDKKGIVVGAAFDDNLSLKHIFVDSQEDLYRLRGSKYVQSEISPDLYPTILDRLNEGRRVLFSGTPCQIAGLRSFLGEPKAGLICCDLVCHGVPSPILLTRYKAYRESTGDRLTDISFRDKSYGWKLPSVRLYQGGGKTVGLYSYFEDPYTVSFFRNFSLRPSCYNCRFTTTQRVGDLTLADFWGVHRKYPEYDTDDKGTSLILVNTAAGQTSLESCHDHLFLGTADIETAMGRNPNLYNPSSRPPKRNHFYRDLEILTFPALIRKYKLRAPTRKEKMFTEAKRKVKRFLRRILQNLNFKERGFS